MVEVERLEHPTDEAWRSLLGACNGNPLHLPAVHGREAGGGNVHALRFLDDGSVVACALALEERSTRLKGLLRGPRRLVLPTSPALADEHFDEAALDALLGYARAGPFERVIVHPAWSRAPSPTLASHSRPAIMDFVLDLRVGHDDLLAGMHKTHRKNIRRAGRQGLRIVEDSSLDGLLCLRDMQQASADRAGERDAGFAIQGTDFFRDLHDRVYSKGIGSVFFACLGEDRVAALAWLHAAGRALTVRSGSLPEGYPVRAMYFLYDELIRHAIHRGMVELNIGGVPSDASDADHEQFGLYEFKKGFGGRSTLRHALDVPLKEDRG